MICAVCQVHIPGNGLHPDHTPAELNIVRTLVNDVAGIQTAIAFLYLWSTSRRDG